MIKHLGSKSGNSTQSSIKATARHGCEHLSFSSFIHE
eukprot:UN04522